MATPTAKDASAERSDESLLARFWTERDQACFAELVSRYQDSAYRIAFARCGRRDLSEDAVQDAFLVLARKREDAVPANFRAWFFAVVTNMTRHRMRSEARGSRRVKSVRYQEEVRMVSADRAQDGACGLDAETRDAIAAALGKLSEELRLPLVLYFVEGMTQDQVGEAVGVSQSLIARRIAQGLEKLRARLALDGVAVSAVALPVMLKDAGLLAAPTGLAHALGSEAFVKLALEGGRQSMRLAAASVGSHSSNAAVAKVAVALLLVVGGMAAAWQFGHGRRADAAHPPAEAAPGTPAVAAKPAAAEPRTLKHWSWDLVREKPPADWLVGEHFAWEPGKGLRTIPNVKSSMVISPYHYRLPLRVEMVVRPNETGAISSGIDLAQGNAYIPRKVYKLRPFDVVNFNQDFRLVSYVYDDYVVHLATSDLPTVVLHFDGAAAFTRMTLTVSNLALKKLTIDEIRREDLPEQVLREIPGALTGTPIETDAIPLIAPPQDGKSPSQDLIDKLNAPFIEDRAP
ncbi:MAG: sigma-70 family RNA polymerase sigma factor [Planctomycetota bacterium]|nr:sigma-70 family RNA polymerase sigma factor [Planctomycetota bacterium]